MPTGLMAEQKVQNATLSLRQLIELIRNRLPADGEAGEVEAFIILNSVLADVINGCWKTTLTRIRGGLDAEEVRTAGAALSLAGVAWREAFQAIQEMAERIGRKTGEPIKGLSELAEEAKMVEEVRLSARRLVDSVNAVFDIPLDPEMLTKSEEDFAAGRFQKDKDVISRLRARRSS